MDTITLNLRVGRTPAASAPAGGELSAAEIDANFTNLKNAAEQLDEEKVAVSDLTPVTDFATPTAGDSIVIQRGSVLYRALVDTLIGGGSAASPLGLWDHWTDWRAASGNANAPGLFAGAAVSSGTNTTALPTGGMAGYNDHGVFLRSSTTANGGYRYQTTSLVGMYFGGVARKYRNQFLWRTSFTGVTVRTGFHDTNTSADAVDGAYFEISGSTCSAKTANNSTRTTHATTITLSLDVAYTFDIEVNAAGSEARFRVWGGNDYDTALMDVTITSNIPTTSARTFGAGIVATESSTTASDIGILYSLGMGTPAGFARLYGVYTPAATAPAAFTAGQWTAAATSTPGEISFDLTALPSDGGSAITSLEYRVNTGSAIAFTGTGTGVRVVTAGLTAGVAVDLQVRAVNAVGAGAWSDIKNRTPAASGGGGALTITDVTIGEIFGGSGGASLTIPAVASGNSLIIATRNADAATTVTGGTEVAAGVTHGGEHVHFFKIENVTDGRTSVTVNAPGGDTSTAVAVLEVDDNALALASTLADDVGTGTTINQAFTTTAANATAVGMAYFSNGVTQTAGSGWSVAPGTSSYDAVNYIADAGAAGAKTTDMTLADSRSWGMVVQAFVRA